MGTNGDGELKATHLVHVERPRQRSREPGFSLSAPLSRCCVGCSDLRPSHTPCREGQIVVNKIMNFDRLKGNGDKIHRPLVQEVFPSHM